MITAIELENFKGIADRVRINLAPLTLVFGPNNAGKSTVLHALNYLRDSIESAASRSLGSTPGKRTFDSGGFARIVHRHDLHRTVSVRVDFDVPGSLIRSRPEEERDPPVFSLDDIDDGINRAWLELRTRAIPNGPRDGAVTEVLVGTSDHPSFLVRSRLPVDEENPVTSALLIDVDFSHPSLEGVKRTNRNKAIEHAFRRNGSVLTFRMYGEPGSSAIPDLDTALELDFSEGLGAQETEPMSRQYAEELMASIGVDPALVPSKAGQLLKSRTRVDYDEELMSTLDRLVDMLVVGALRLVVQELRKALHVGPLRVLPPRTMHFEDPSPDDSWLDGSRAWLELYHRPALLSAMNSWLPRLGLDLDIRIRRFYAREVEQEDVALDSPHAVVGRIMVHSGAERGGDRFPSELGVGFAQLVPVIAATLTQSDSRIVMLEQPELHIHPALQVALGDLFIEQAASRQFIIETHSEHIILRLLRRIRETAAGELPAGAPAFDPSKLSVLYVEPGETGTTIRRLGVDATGEFTDRWPRGFFEERAEELF